MTFRNFLLSSILVLFAMSTGINGQLGFGQEWMKLTPDQPLFSIVGQQAWNSQSHPFNVGHVFYDSDAGAYSYYVTGFDGANLRIGLFTATVLTGNWNIADADQNPVLDLGAPGSWDEAVVAEPVVVEYNGQLLMFYNGVGTDEGIGLATSSDGIVWQRNGSEPVLKNEGITWEGTPFGCYVLVEDDTLKMWYGGNDGAHDRIGYAWSVDGGQNWIRHEQNPVLDIGSGGDWDSAQVLFPIVRRENGMYLMWYTGIQSMVGVAQGGFAMSADGVNWDKDPSNPVLVTGASGSWDESGVVVQDVFLDGDNYYMLYLGAGSILYDVGLAYIPSTNISSEDVQSGLPQTIKLYQNYPNPFNPSTVISLQLPVTSHTTLTVFDTQGRTVRELVNHSLASGHHSILWDGVGDNGRRAASGIYFYQLRVEGQVWATKKMILVQ